MLAKHSFILLFSLLIIINAQASSKIGIQLDKKRTQIQNMVAKIKTLEEKIGQENDNYLDNVENYNRFNKKMNMLSDKLTTIEINVLNEQNMVKRILLQMVNDKADNYDDESELKIHLKQKVLKRRLIGLKRQSLELVEMKKTVAYYNANLDQMKSTEKDLYQLIVDLEERKKDLSLNYKGALSEKLKLEDKYDTARASKKVAKKVRRQSGKTLDLPFNIKLPISSYKSYKATKLGVTFQFNEELPVKATAAGKINYAGKLSAYGNVIVIEHKDGIRSVLLGDIKMLVKKGTQVKAGDVIGRTQLTQGDGRNLYFEMRKKNKVLNTISLLKKYNSKFKKI